MNNMILQEVQGGCFVWEMTPEGLKKVDFYDSMYVAQQAYPEASRGPLPQELITDFETH